MGPEIPEKRMKQDQDFVFSILLRNHYPFDKINETCVTQCQKFQSEFSGLKLQKTSQKAKAKVFDCLGELYFM